MTVTGETDRVFLTEFYASPGVARRGRPCRTPREDVAVELQIADAPINSGPQLQDVWPTRAIVCLALVTHIYRRLSCGKKPGGNASGAAQCNYVQDHRRTGLSPGGIIRTRNGRRNACFS